VISGSTNPLWVIGLRKCRDEHPASEDLNISERARLKELEKENRELRQREHPRTAGVFEKSRSLVRQGTMSEKYELIAVEKADPASPYPVIKMCAWLGVSTSGFYDHDNAVETNRQRRRAKIITHVQAAYRLGRATYGVRRVHAVLTRSHDPEVASCSEKQFAAHGWVALLNLGERQADRLTTSDHGFPPSAGRRGLGAADSFVRLRTAGEPMCTLASVVR
jgi:hypothetical protein